MGNPIIEQDLSKVLELTKELWPNLQGARLFITGGTGFIGCWLLETLREANRKLDLNLSACILTRSEANFRQKIPKLSRDNAFQILEGDISNFEFPEGEFSHLIHAATDASAELTANNPVKMFDTIVEGTRRALDFSVARNIPRVLFLSSGAVYGNQPWDIKQVPENWTGGPDPANAANCYAEGKRAAEMLCAIYQKQFGSQIVTARIFALLGPYLALGTHFAAGNFLRDAMAGKPVIVNGNGLPCRSYLYASDLAVWLLTLLLRGAPGGAYNVGSNQSVSISQLAERVASLIGSGEYEILGKADQGWNLGRYVPDTTRAQTELGLLETVTLDDAIIRTALWNGWKK